MSWIKISLCSPYKCTSVPPLAASDVAIVYDYELDQKKSEKVEFSPNKDLHVIADCVKYVLRELPSSPVPASCCNALLDSFRKSERQSHSEHRGKQSEAQQQHILDRGKSESHLSIEVDKGLLMDSNSFTNFNSSKHFPSPKNDTR